MSRTIIVQALAKTGTVFIELLLRNLIKLTSWHPLTEADLCVLGPIRWKLRYIPGADYIIHLRNPLDHLVSRYYSIGWYHPKPSPEVPLQKWERQRAEARSMSVDDWCLKKADQQIKETMALIGLAHLSRATVLTYEQMWCNYDGWVAGFLEPFHLAPGEVYEITEIQRELVRVPPTINQQSHVRHGEPGESLEQLQPETVTELQERSKLILDYMDTLPK